MAQVTTGSVPGKEPEWLHCQGYIIYRAELSLGTRRPLTQWVNNGVVKAPDYWWQVNVAVLTPGKVHWWEHNVIVKNQA